MLNLITKLFFPKTIDSVMSTFRKTVEDLGKVAAKHFEKRDNHLLKVEEYLDKVDHHEAEAEAHRVEAKAALKLANKLEDTFGLN